jgi:GT2 family glycosyltransferase
MNDNKNIKVSIIIPTYNRCQSLERALQSIAKLDFPREQFEVVVVDNNSSDATPEVADKFRNVGIAMKYVKEIRLSFTVARHSGAEAASGKILSYIDDDVIVSSGWLAGLTELFKNGDDRVGVVGGPILPVFEAEPPEWIKRYYPMSIWLSLFDCGLEVHEEAGACGPNLSVRKDILQLVGGFPADTIGVEAEGRPGVVEKIYVGSGDYGLCLKVKKAGYKVMYAPKALVHHVIPPVRLTKKWWHSRLVGEGCYHALTQQYEREESRVMLFVRSLFSTCRAVINAMRFTKCAIMRTGKERYEFLISYYLSRARVEFALVRRPDLARRLWNIALTGVLPQDIDQLVRLLP